LGNLATPLSVQKLQTALHAKAKDEPGCRFHALYDKLYREDVLRHAYQCCRANHGAPGVDGVQFEDIEASGLESWLGELANTLKEKSYQPEAVRRVYIPKPNGKLRPLGIPTIRDRVVQMAMVLVIGPIFEADLPPQLYAYRPGRNAHDAVRQVHSLLNQGHTQVVDADLAAYFDQPSQYPPQEPTYGSKVRCLSLPALSLRNALSVAGRSGNRYNLVRGSRARSIVPLWMRS
jgi:RNA-directed DNA polymerase